MALLDVPGELPCLLRVDAERLMGKTAKLFTHGGSQAVRLPREFRFDGREVRIRRDGDKVILEPLERDWAATWSELDRLQAEAGELFPERPDQSPPREADFATPDGRW
jgi:antitoxin VapB